jgi:hypothetical protein
MVAEAQEFVAAVLRAERPLADLIHSDWAMLNGRLAEHYGIAGVDGDAFRRVELSPQHHRGGLLTQAGVLSLTSDGQRHRPVHRGVWLLETILDRPPPPPPADVPAIEPTPVGQRKMSIRDKLAAHRNDAACAGCHRRIDPLGLAFDHYDAIGRWRARERANDGRGEDPLVDASGELPDGRRFADAAGFKRLLLADLDQVATALTRKLAAYAIRRPVTIDDHVAIAAIVERSRQRGHTLRALVEELLSSGLFVRR